MMKINILTIFPEMFESVLKTSILKRAQENKLVKIRLHHLRHWATDKHRQVDDRPYGGGPGMVMRVDIIDRALQDLRQNNPQAPVILLSPQGETYRQAQAEKLVKEPGLILVAGHYEGYDERLREYVDLELSIGDYVLTGGELPALIVVDSLTRLIPGVLGDENSAAQDSFSSGQLDYPEYTKPRIYRGQSVPEVLLSGNHAQIKQWRADQARKKTQEKRPDLLKTD